MELTSSQAFFKIYFKKLSIVDILNKIKNNCENVEIKDAPFFYDINVFNTCEENGYLLITLDCWENVHPAFKTIPLTSGEKIAYGVIYSKEPSTGASKFLDLIKNEFLKRLKKRS